MKIYQKTNARHLTLCPLEYALQAALATGLAVPANPTNAAETVRASESTSGAQANVSSSHPSISADGRYVAFESAAGNLVGSDTNLASDIFIKDLLTQVILKH